jgi:hypothetical protein
LVDEKKKKLKIITFKDKKKQSEVESSGGAINPFTLDF